MAPDNSDPDLIRRAEKLIKRQERNQRKAWAEGYLDGICAMLRPGDLVMDCGANRGDITSRLAATGADVVAYDPDPWAFTQLRERFTDTMNVTLVHAALARDAGQVTLHRAEAFDANPAGGSVKSTILEGGRAIDDSQGIDVDCLAFDAEIERLLRTRSEIAFIKMDIEGAELEILEHAVNHGLLDAVRAMVVETHERKFKDLRGRFRALRDLVIERGLERRIHLDWI